MYITYAHDVSRWHMVMTYHNDVFSWQLSMTYTHDIGSWHTFSAQIIMVLWWHIVHDMLWWHIAWHMLSWHITMTHHMTYVVMTYHDDISHDIYVMTYHDDISHDICRHDISHDIWFSPFLICNGLVSLRCRIKTICHAICHWGTCHEDMSSACVIAYVIVCH